MPKTKIEFLLEQINGKNFSKEIYEQNFDSFLFDYECKGLHCNKMESYKEIFQYLLDAFKSSCEKNEKELEIYSEFLHDIKAPVFATNLVLSQDIAKDSIDELSKLNQELLLNIQAFLDIYSKELKLIQSNLKCIKLQDVINEFVNLYKSYAKAKGIRVFVEDFSFEIFINEKDIKRILQNIFINAVKYSKNNSYIKIYFQNNRLFFENKLDNVDASYGSNKIGFYIIEKTASSNNLEFNFEIINDVAYSALKFPKSI